MIWWALTRPLYYYTSFINAGYFQTNAKKLQITFHIKCDITWWGRYRALSHSFQYGQLKCEGSINAKIMPLKLGADSAHSDNLRRWAHVCASYYINIAFFGLLPWPHGKKYDMGLIGFFDRDVIKDWCAEGIFFLTNKIFRPPYKFLVHATGGAIAHIFKNLVLVCSGERTQYVYNVGSL